jgi:hypothetical protein
MSRVKQKALSDLPSQEPLEGGSDSAPPFTSNTVASFPADTNLSVGYLQGGRPSGQRGKQIICTIFDKPTRLRRIRLEFLEMESARTQEFSLQWSAEPGGHSARSFASSGVFSLQGSTSEIEDYQVNLDTVSILELAIKPELTPDNASQPWQGGA